MKPRAPAISRSGLVLAKSLDEVAEIMTSRGHPMTVSQVRTAEGNALKKLAEHPEVRMLACEVGMWVD